MHASAVHALRVKYGMPTAKSRQVVNHAIRAECPGGARLLDLMELVNKMCERQACPPAVLDRLREIREDMETHVLKNSPPQEQTNRSKPMSETNVDFAKVNQALDNGWTLSLRRAAMSDYEVLAIHPDPRLVRRALDKLDELLSAPGCIWQEDHHTADTSDGLGLYTTDFTPEAAMTRMAYKIHGEII